MNGPIEMRLAEIERRLSDIDRQIYGTTIVVMRLSKIALLTNLRGNPERTMDDFSKVADAARQELDGIAEALFALRMNAVRMGQDMPDLREALRLYGVVGVDTQIPEASCEE